MKKYNKVKRIYQALTIFMVILTLFTVSVFAEEQNPLDVVNNLSSFLFGLVRAIGAITIGFAIVQIGMSFKTHDPSQKANGFMTLAGGVIIMFAEQILNLITGAGGI